MASFNTKPRSASTVRRGNELPLTHTGYLKKLGQKHKNWKRRYIVVELGRLTYFEKSNGTVDPPYGLNQKGMITLNGYEVADGPREATILLKHRTDSTRELLVEAEEGNLEAQNWREIFKHHIQFCDDNPTLFLQVGATFPEDEAKRAAAALTFRGVADVADRNDPEDESAPGLSAPKPIQLVPGFVIKSKRLNGQKVFFNVCEHETIPQSDKKRGNKRWPLIVLSPSWTVSVDKKAEQCHVLDCAIHPSVVAQCIHDTTGEVKEEVCAKVMDAVCQREKKDKSIEAALDRNVFSFPRLAKKYKGDVVPSFLVPRNIQQLKKNTSVFTALDLANHVEDLEALLEEAEDDLTGVSGAPRRFVPVRVERQSGAVVRDGPDKSASRSGTLPEQATTHCYGRREAPDGSCWYRVLEGWIPAVTDGGQRIIRPNLPSPQPPLVCSLEGFNMVEVREKGLFFDSTAKKISFSLRLACPPPSDDSGTPLGQESILFLQRTYDEFRILRDKLRMARGEQEDQEFPEVARQALEGKDMPVELLLELMEDLAQWLKSRLSAPPVPSLIDFLQPDEADCARMDVELSAVGGLFGAWPGGYQ